MLQNTLPDYHFLLIPSDLGAEWLFDAARLYWQRFAPIVVSDFEFVRLVPPDQTVTVTVLARRDRAAQLGVELAQARPDALFDPVVYDLFDDMRAELNRRADNDEPFGVPLAITQVAPATPLAPTPGPLVAPTRQPGGFITQTPAPTPAAPAESEPTRVPPTPPPPDLVPTDGESRPTIAPTPGSLIGS